MQQLGLSLGIEAHVSVMTKTIPRLTFLMSTTYISKYPAVVQYSIILLA